MHKRGGLEREGSRLTEAEAQRLPSRQAFQQPKAGHSESEQCWALD